MTRILIDDIAIKDKYSIIESSMRLYSKIKKNTSTHCCVLGINKTTDINENASSPSFITHQVDKRQITTGEGGPVRDPKTQKAIRLKE